jgi:hypothetical protein
MSDEPSVLDYVKSLLTPWRGKPLPIPQIEHPAEDLPGLPLAEQEQQGMQVTPVSSSVVDSTFTGEAPLHAQALPQAMPEALPAIQALSLPWRSLVALGLALMAQIALQPRSNRGWELGAFLYLWAAAWTIWGSLRGEWKLAPIPQAIHKPDNNEIRLGVLLVSAPLALLAFLAFGGNVFDKVNVTLWLLALGTLFAGLWVGRLQISSGWERLRQAIRDPIQIKLTGWAVILVLAASLVIFFRVYQLADLPPEMVSDHAEKLLDVGDVLNGQTSIFFPRNTGREAFQMYLTAAVARLFNTGLSFMSLKIGTTLAGLVTLIYIYKLGAEISNRWVGLFSMMFAGMAYWSNIITRIALRFPLYPLFVATTLYYLIRGLRSRNRNDFLLAGLFLGIGLHGYSPFRLMPFIILVAFVLYALHRQSARARKQAFTWLAVLALVSLYVFLPLLRYSLQEPQMFSYRALTRMGSVEQPLPGPALLIFLQNLWKALIMFAWDNGEVWVLSIPHHPALDIVSAALFHLGIVLLFVRYLRQRHWIDLFLLLSIPLLMMPSILSLAFPQENPILNRTAGAIVPVFLVVGLCLDGLLRGIKAITGTPRGARLAWGMGIFLLFWSSLHNYGLVFDKYQQNYELSAWNTSEMGEVVHDFGTIFGSTENVWVVAFPHWVDTRLVGINAGEPQRDLAIQPDMLSETAATLGAKLFMIKPEDESAVQTLQALYPQGTLQVYESQVDKDFLLFLVLPEMQDSLNPGEQAPH